VKPGQNQSKLILHLTVYVLRFFLLVTQLFPPRHGL